MKRIKSYITKEVNNYINSKFARNVLTLFTGTSIAQIIPFFVSPILTRLYKPEDFGILALFTAVFSIVAIISTFQYEAAIVLPKEDDDAANIVGLCLLITSAISFLTLLVIIFFKNTITFWLGEEKLEFWLYFIPIPIFLYGLYNTLNYWATRRKQYKRIAARTISQSATTSGVKMAMGFAGFLNSGLITGTIVGQATSTSVLGWLTWKDDKNELKRITKTGIIKNAKKYIDFFKYTNIHSFLDVFNSSGVIILLNYFFNSQLVGFYSFTFGIMMKPLQLLSTSISQVFYEKISKTYLNNQSIWNISRIVIKQLVIYSILFFIPILLFSEIVFKLFFGEEWSYAGKIARILVPWLFFRFICSPIANIPQVLNRQKDFLFLNLLLNLGVPGIILFMGIYDFSFFNILLVISIYAGIYFLFQLFWIKKISVKADKMNCL